MMHLRGLVNSIFFLFIFLDILKSCAYIIERPVYKDHEEAKVILKITRYNIPPADFRFCSLHSLALAMKFEQQPVEYALQT